jgi:hypothetical protein
LSEVILIYGGSNHAEPKISTYTQPKLKYVITGFLLLATLPAYGTIQDAYNT